MVKFTIDLAADGDPETYDALIVDIRDRLAVGDRIENVPSLPPQVPFGGQLEFFDVNLSYTNSGTTFTVQVRFRTDNLYLVGYRPHNSSTWYELRHGEKSDAALINEADTTTEILGFGENYNNLTGVAQMGLDEIPLSSSRIGQAITTLAGNPPDQKSAARAILTLAFAIAEAARLRDISSLVSRSWWTESYPGSQFANRVRSWARLSAAVQRTRNEGHTFDFAGESTGIWSFVEAILALGIMCMANTASRSSASSSRPKRSTTNMTDGQGALTSYAPGQYAQGQPLLEIFRVRINNIDGESPGNLYGTIAVDDSVGNQSIWSRDQNHYVNINPGEDILIEGPSRALSSADEFYINLDLWDYDSLSSDDPIAKGSIAFNPLDYYTEYDVVKHREVTADNGSVTVSYMAITDGLYAQITVILVNGDSEDPADVYGEITANNGNGQSELFRKASSEHVNVKPHQQIPLSRAVVAVPTKDSLLINAHLWDYDAVSGDDEIAWGSVEFQPMYRMSESKKIVGSNGEIEVRVTWM